MIDKKYQVRRYIAEYSESTEELLAEYDFCDFDLAAFQKEFSEPEPENPMYDCYQVKEENVEFIHKFIEKEPEWDFVNKSYFVEARAV